MLYFRYLIFIFILFIGKVCHAQLLQLPIKKDFLEFHKTKHLDFIENKGQWEQQIRFKAKLSEATAFFESDRFVFVLLHPKQHEKMMGYKLLEFNVKQATPPPSSFIDAHAYAMKFVDSNPQTEVVGKHSLPFYHNYFIGNNPNNWASNVPLYHEIIYKNLYEGIDLKVFEKDGLFKHDFIVAPNINPNIIRIEFEGVLKTELQSQNLVIHTSVNKMTKLKPYAYQIINNETVEVPCQFVLRNNILSYRFPNGYNTEHSLIIDPVVIFSTYSGSTADNWGYTATYDQNGNLYAGGSVFSIGYPTTIGAYQVNFGGGVCDIAISKFNSSGTSLLYSTYLGGSGSEVPHSLIVNSLNELFVYGTTGSANFPMAGNSFDNTFNGGTAYTLTGIIQYPNGSDIIVAKISSDGTQLLASTYIGGSGNDGLNMYAPLKNNYADDCRGEILLDNNDNVFIVSTTSSQNFPVSANAFQPTYGGGLLDGCIVKIDNTLSNILWASYIGGSALDAVYSITLDEFNNPVIAGGTSSTNFPVTAGVVNSNYKGGTCDGFITRISENGEQILNSTYWGTTVYDQVYFVELDKFNNVYVLGQTRDATSSLHNNAQWFTPGGGQFISKLNPTLTTIEWSTIFGTGGGTVNISPTAFLVDYCNNIYLSGWGSPILNGFGGTAGLPITPDAVQQTTDNNDYYFMAIADDASSLTYASYYGGPISREHVDGGTSRFDRSGKIYQAVCAGCGGNHDFPTTPGVWSNTNNSINCNIGVVKIDFQLPVLVASFSSTAPVCLPDHVQFYNNSNAPTPSLLNCYWDFGDGNTSTNCNPTHLYDSAGIYTVMLAVEDLSSCNFNDTTYLQVLVLNNTIDTLDTVNICAGDIQQIGIPPYIGQNVTYQWTPSTFLSNTSISNPICSAPYTMNYMLLISNGVCIDTLYQTVNVTDLTANAGNDTIICHFNHTLIGTANGGSSNTQYHWSSNSQFTDMLNNSPDEHFANITVTSPGWFYLQVSDAGCFDIDSIYIQFYEINASFSHTKPLCHGDCNGSLTISISGGNPPFSYLWNNMETTQTIQGLCSGTYSVSVTDDDGCQNVATFQLEEPQPVQIQLTIQHVPCAVACIGTIQSSTTGGTPPYNYSWSNGFTQPNLSGLCAGKYNITVTDSNGCTDTISSEIEIHDIYENVQLWADKDTIWRGESTVIHASEINGVTYSWTPTIWTSTPNEPSTTVTPPVGTWTFTVVIDDGNGCIYTDSITVTVLDVYCEEPYIFIPNAFTPDGDGKNDILYVRGIYIEEMELLIFDRWGNVVFETMNQQHGWDGTYKGKKAEPGVYVYQLKIICFGNTQFQKKGNITLIR